MIYIASPYSTPIPTVLEERVKAVRQFTAACIAQGLPAFSPIAYFHPFATAMNMPTDAGFWNAVNMQFLRKADAVFLLCLMGWENSKGVKVELNVAKLVGIPIVKYGPDFKVLQ